MRLKRLLTFLTLLSFILGTAAFYVCARLMEWWNFPETHYTALWSLIAAFILLQITLLVSYRSHAAFLSSMRWFYGVGYLLLGVLGCLFFYTLFADVTLFLFEHFFPALNASLLEHNAVIIVLFLTAISVIFGVIQASRAPHVKEVDVPFEHLPEALDGFRILQLTDLHIGPVLKEKFVEQIVKLSNQKEPHLIAVTGDLIDGTVLQLQDLVAPLQQLRSTFGTYFITGNHEYIWDANAWIECAKRLGMKVLLNEHVIIQKEDAAFVLAGITDYSAGSFLKDHASDPEKAQYGAPQELVKVVLAHQPASYKDTAKAGFDLQISGHTHGGQFFPWSTIVRLVERYSKGLNQHGKMWIYTSCGAGFWGPPLRFLVPREITLIRLRTKRVVD